MAGEAQAAQQRANLVRAGIIDPVVQQQVIDQFGGGTAETFPAPPEFDIGLPVSDVGPVVPVPLAGAGPLADLDAGIPSLQPVTGVVQTPELATASLIGGAPLPPPELQAGGLAGSPELSGRQPIIPATGVVQTPEQAALALPEVPTDQPQTIETFKPVFAETPKGAPPPAVSSQPTPAGPVKVDPFGGIGVGFELDTAIDALGDAQVEKALVEGRFGDAVERLFELNAVKTEDDLKPLRILQNQIQQNITNFQDRLEQITADIEKTKIDPERFWKNKSTGQKIAASIALALGAFGAGLTGQKNTAAEIINNAINADIDAQESDLVSKQRAGTLVSNQLNTAMKRFGDIGLSKSALRAASIQRLQNQIEQKKATFLGEREKAKADVLIQGLEVKKQEALIEGRNTAAKRAIEEAKLENERFKARTGRIEAEAKAAEGRQRGGEVGEISASTLNEKERKLFIPSLNDRTRGVIANNTQDFERVQKVRVFSTPALVLIDRLKQISDSAGPGGVEVLDRAVVATAKAVGEALVLMVKDLFALGALQQHERALIEQIVPANIVSGFELLGVNTAKLEALRGIVETFQESSFKNAGVVDTSGVASPWSFVKTSAGDDKVRSTNQFVTQKGARQAPGNFGANTGLNKQQAAALIQSFKRLRPTDKQAAQAVQARRQPNQTVPGALN